MATSTSTSTLLQWDNWFWNPEPGSVRRAVWIAVVWAYIGAFGVVILGAIAALVLLASSGIVYLANFGERTFVLAEVLQPMRLVALFVIPLGYGAAVWAAAYGSTRSGSFARGVLATAVGLFIGVVFFLFGLTGVLLAALATGWAVALPADHIGRWAIRAGLGVFLAAFSPSWDEVTLLNGLVVLALSPLLAGVIVWLADYAWHGLNSIRAGAEPVVIARSVSTLAPTGDDKVSSTDAANTSDGT